MNNIETTDYFVRIIINLIRYLQPIYLQQPTTSSSHSLPNQSNHNPNYHNHRRHRYQRYRRFNLNNKLYRGCIILRAHQITQQNQLIAAQAEQSLINAILQAREEHQFFSNRLVPVIRTQNKRSTRLLENQEFGKIIRRIRKTH